MSAGGGGTLHYRGWVLVDLHVGRYAAKGDRRVRVCGLHEGQAATARKFREAVDREESR